MKNFTSAFDQKQKNANLHLNKGVYYNSFQEQKTEDNPILYQQRATGINTHFNCKNMSEILLYWYVWPTGYIVKSLSCVCLFVTPWTVAYPAPQSMGFSRQEYWSELLFPSPGDLPDPGIEPRSPAL